MSTADAFHQQLRRAVGCLQKADTELAKIASRRQLLEVSSPDHFETGVPGKTEARWKMIAVRRELEDCLQTSEAAQNGGEDSAVEVILQQYTAALKNHEKALEWIKQEKEGLTRYTMMVKGLERDTRKRTFQRERYESGEGECNAWLQKRIDSLLEARDNLRRDNQELGSKLRERGVANLFINAHNAKLERDIGDAQKRADQARQVLAQRAASNLKTFRAAREAEMAAADEVHQQAAAQCEKYIDKLQQEARKREAAFDSYKKVLKDDVQDFRDLYEGKRDVSTKILRQQEEDYRQELAEAERQVIFALRRFKEMLHEKRWELEREIAAGRLSVQTAVEVSRRQMEVHLQELLAAFRNKLQWERRRVASHVKQAKAEVADAQAQAKARQQQAHVIRENYRMHAIKSKDYVKQMGGVQRKQLYNLQWRLD